MVSLRLGAPVTATAANPGAWIEALKAKGYRAAFSPLTVDSSPAERQEYALAAQEADITIAEVGSWCNPLSIDREEGSAAFKKCVDSMRLADDLGALCCANISGN